MPHKSVFELFESNTIDHADTVAAMVKRGGAYQDVTWGELGRSAKEIAAGLIALDVECGDRICILSDTRLEWVLCDMGILGAGAVTVPIYGSSLSDEVQYICDNSGAVVIFAEDAAQVDKLQTERGRLGGIRKVVQLTGDVHCVTGDWIISLEDLVALGTGCMPMVDERCASLDGESILTIMYTSGTTGRPKGVITTHDNMLYEAECMSEAGVIRHDDTQLLFLPLAHSFAKTIEVTWLANRHILAFAENLGQILTNLQEVRPTLMCAVPRVFEKFHAAIVAAAISEGGVKKQIFQRAEAVSASMGKSERRHKHRSLRQTAEAAILRKLVFNPIGARLRERLGGRMRVMVSGGAPLAPKLAFFFRDVGITILEGYGLTETAAGAFINRPGKARIGTVGEAFPGSEVRIADDGEVLIKGRHVMRGYWLQPDATAEVLDDDGWLSTGDLGRLDGSGYLTITGRKKDIIVTAGGKNIAPQNIENLLKSDKLISQAVVHGDRRKYLTALVTIDPDALKQLAGEHGFVGVAHAELIRKPIIQRAVDDVVQEANRHLNRNENIKKYRIMPRDFTLESGELTPSLKVKRSVVNERNIAIFDALYSED